MQTNGKTAQFEDMKLEETILEKEFKLTWTQAKECFKKSTRKKNSNRTAKKKCKKNIYKKTRQEKQHMAGAGFNTNKNISHYVNDRKHD